jgi:transposase
MTFLPALRSDRIDAPCVMDQPIKGDRFPDYVEQCLVPTLSAGDVVIMDNLSNHKRPAFRSAIRCVGARLLFLPPYSPDLNPIEQACPMIPRTIGCCACQAQTPHAKGRRENT